MFACTYDVPSAEFAIRLGVDGIKLNSSDLSNFDLLAVVARSGIPFTLGTGASTIEEIAQAIEYCIENSLEAGNRSNTEVSISCELYDNDNLQINIKDNGIGIDDMNLKKVFDPFFSTKYNHEGLGLYFCRTIVERNSGTVEIFSQNGNGTLVKMRFPVQEEFK